jgi:general secretion pathway protein G
MSARAVSIVEGILQRMKNQINRDGARHSWFHSDRVTGGHGDHRIAGALVMPRLFKNVGKSKVTATKAQIASFQTALGAYKLDVGIFPGTDEGLQALRTKPSSATKWDGPYLPKEIPMDPWGNPYRYKFPGEHGDEPDIISYGADGREGGDGENADIYS